MNSNSLSRNLVVLRARVMFTIFALKGTRRMMLLLTFSISDSSLRRPDRARLKASSMICTRLINGISWKEMFSLKEHTRQPQHGVRTLFIPRGWRPALRADVPSYQSRSWPCRSPSCWCWPTSSHWCQAPCQDLSLKHGTHFHTRVPSIAILLTQTRGTSYFLYRGARTAVQHRHFYSIL